MYFAWTMVEPARSIVFWKCGDFNNFYKQKEKKIFGGGWEGHVSKSLFFIFVNFPITPPPLSERYIPVELDLNTKHWICFMINSLEKIINKGLIWSPLLKNLKNGLVFLYVYFVQTKMWFCDLIQNFPCSVQMPSIEKHVRS